MKKALYVATIDAHIRAFHLPYLKLLHDNGYEVHVATNGDEEFPNCDKKHQICIERSPFKLNNLKAIKELKKIIDEEKFDIIHCHTPMGAVVARLAAKKARHKYGTRVIYTAHGFHFYKGSPKLNWLLFYPVEKYLAKYTDTLITINKEDYELAKNKFSKRCKDIQYVPGVGIDTKKFDIKMSEKEKNKFKESLGLKPNDYVLTCVARLDKNKNQGFLIDVMEELVKENKNIHLLLVGPDELNGYYQKLSSDKKLDNNVHFLGRREDVPELLAITDIVVSASLREGLPVNVMEAFAAGKPVVALNCRGMKDLVEDGKNGYVVDQKDCDGFSKYIKKIHLDGNKNLDKKGQTNIKNYLLEKTINIFKSIYALNINNPNEYENEIDIIMGIYNCGNYLEKSIDSIINQTFSKWRLIICDDGSKDNSYKIAKKYKEKYPNKILLLRNSKNMGLNYTLNKCLENSSAKYIARMDGDDYCDKTRLEKEYYFLERHNEYALVSTCASLFDDNGIWGNLKLAEKPNKNDFLKTSPFCHASVMVREDIMKKVNGYTVSDKLLRVEDYHLWFKIYYLGFRGYNIQENLYYIRDDRNATNRRTWKNRKNEFYVRKIGYKMLNIPYYKRIYAFRPIILGLMPKSLYELLHRKNIKNGQ